ATLLLFRMLLETEGAAPVFKSFLNARSQEATLPPALPRETFEKLPTQPGVYYFKNGDGKIIYVGKAINIKKRILGHFYDKTSKEVRLCHETADIDYELSGSELLALLMESAAIKHHYPQYNSAQKSNNQPYGIFSYEDRNGIVHLAYNKVKMISRPIALFNNPTDCRTYLEEVCKQFELCPKYCHLQENIVSCSHYSIDHCKGVCRGKESAAQYNGRVLEALEALSRKNENLVIKERGRTPSEEAFVLIKDGHYCGYGFLDKHSEINSEADLEVFLNPQKNSMDSQRIINAYLNKKTTRTWLFSESMGS
ncbi:MAG: GIY-YIG nuclease family protein, partial [Flavobacteriaceae bacterium]